MLVAVRSMSIGEHELAAGDVVTPEMERVLPAGRITKLLNAGWVRNAADDTMSLEQRVDQLERLVAQLLQQSQTRAPRAPETQE